MNVGELFVSLGVKGSEKTVGAITGVQKGLQATAGASLEAKAAIVGAMYALERLFAASGSRGTELANFTASLGMSAKTLQQYQYAARQVNISNQEMENTFRALQVAMTKTLTGQGTPAGLARVASVIGRSFTKEDVEAFQKSPDTLFRVLEEYAKKESNIGLRNDTLKSFSVSDTMAGAMAGGAFAPSVLAKAPTYSDKEIAALHEADRAWGNLGQKIQMAIGHFNALHGQQLVADFSTITNSVIKLAEQFVKLSDAAHLFKALDMVFKGWGLIFEEMTAAIKQVTTMTAAAAAIGTPEQEKTHEAFKKTTLFSLLNPFFEKEPPPPARPYTQKEIDERQAELKAEGPAVQLLRLLLVSIFGTMPTAAAPGAAGVASPSFPAQVAPPRIAPQAAAPAAGGVQNNNVKVTVNVTDTGGDAKKIASEVGKSVKDAVYVLPSLNQGK